jgi:hypothetical protein
LLARQLQLQRLDVGVAFGELLAQCGESRVKPPCEVEREQETADRRRDRRLAPRRRQIHQRRQQQQPRA